MKHSESWYLAPHDDLADEWRAGEANKFSSQQDAEAAIPGLASVFATPETYWVAVKREVAP